MHLGTAAVWTPCPHQLSPPYTHPPLRHVATCASCAPEIPWKKNAMSGIRRSLWFPPSVSSILSIPLFQHANCKCRYKELPPESTDFKLNSDKGAAAARTQTLSDFSLRQGFEITAGFQFPLSSRADLGPSRRQPLWGWGPPSSVRFSIYYNY